MRLSERMTFYLECARDRSALLPKAHIDGVQRWRDQVVEMEKQIFELNLDRSMLLQALKAIEATDDGDEQFAWRHADLFDDARTAIEKAEGGAPRANARPDAIACAQKSLNTSSSNNNEEG